MYRAQAVAKEAKTVYEIVTQRVLTEFSFFQEQKIIDLRDILLNFVEKQVCAHHSHFVYSFTVVVYWAW